MCWSVLRYHPWQLVSGSPCRNDGIRICVYIYLSRPYTLSYSFRSKKSQTQTTYETTKRSSSRHGLPGPTVGWVEQRKTHQSNPTKQTPIVSTLRVGTQTVTLQRHTQPNMRPNPLNNIEASAPAYPRSAYERQKPHQLHQINANNIIHKN